MQNKVRYHVTAVVVSYNREQLLKECLDGLAAQTRPADHVIVIDNASTDHALQVAQSHPIGARVVPLPENLGGAGGFCAGIALAASMQKVNAATDTNPTKNAPISADGATRAADTRTDTPAESTVCVPLVWLMDDDTIPLPGALEALLAAEDDCLRTNGILPVALGSKAIWTDGREHLMNKPKERLFPAKGERVLPDCGGAYQVRSLSFVSCLLNVQAILGMHRLPRAAYFLWNDDYEYTTALLKNGIGYYVPTSEVMHKTKVFGSSDANPGARFYYEVRNKIWLLRYSHANFAGAGLLLYLIKTARRWTLTLLRNRDDNQLRDCLKRGWHDGWHTTMPTNKHIFAAMSDVEAAIIAVEQEI